MDNPMAISIGWSSQFERKFDNNINQALVVSKVRELVDIFEQSENQPVGAFTKLKPITGPVSNEFKKRGLRIQETRLTYSSRLVYSYSNKSLQLIEFAETPTHTIIDEMNRWPKSKISNVINSIHPADQSFLELLSDKDMFFAFEGVDGGQRSRFEEQYFNEWLTFLDQPQIQIRDEIVKAVQTNLTGFECTLLLGGPGTGKTVVLTSAANQLAKLGMNSRFEVPPGVKDQLIATGNFLPRSNQNWNAFFLDDPIALDDLEEAIVETKSLNRQLIVAIDPTQWRERKTIERFHELLRTEKPKILELRHGYRQGGAIGREAVKMVHTFLKKSSAYSEQSKRDSERAKAKRWENLCLKELNFSDNNGTWIIGSQAADGNYLVKALQAFDLAAEFKSEKTWPNVLVALSNPNNLPPGLRTLENYAKHKYPKLNTSDLEG
jgi:hypothetical protein